MLNPFPELLYLSQLGPFIIRVVVGIVFLDLGYLLFRNEKESWVNSFKILNIKKPELVVKVFGLTEIIGGAALVLGFATQITILVLALMTLAETYLEYKDPTILKRNLIFYILILSILTSLLLSGAGAFALDLPL